MTNLLALRRLAGLPRRAVETQLGLKPNAFYRAEFGYASAATLARIEAFWRDWLRVNGKDLQPAVAAAMALLFAEGLSAGRSVLPAGHRSGRTARRGQPDRSVRPTPPVSKKNGRAVA